MEAPPVVSASASDGDGPPVNSYSSLRRCGRWGARPGPRPAGEGEALYTVLGRTDLGRTDCRNCRGRRPRAVVTENISDFQTLADPEAGIQIENWFSE
jgi:hypothetical protein